MADRTRKWPQNVPGRYYVDEECMDCHLCSEIAAANFSNEPGEGHDFLSKQPESEEEEALCTEAMDSCPVEAIGDDGEQ